MKETSVEQVQDCVFDASDVLIDGKPVVSPLVEHRAVLVATGIPRVIPRRFHKGVECIGFAFRRRLTARTLGVDEFGKLAEGRAAVVYFDVFG